ncbi:MAG: PaaI family thioesterase [Chitinophagaceae bacterium]|nr:PaaI family thioesterase [Chitinophagaceae bacterium]
MENQIHYQLKQLEGQYFSNTNSRAGKWLNYKLLEVKQGEIRASVLVREDMTNPNHMLHGGMIAMIMDELCGLAFYSLGTGYYYTTVNLSVDYLDSAPVNTTVEVHSKVMRSGKKIANVECTVFNDEGKIIAHGKSNLVNTEKKVFELRTHHT